ncbi:Ig-like domain-containing protein [Rhizobium leguminosarum]|uniref:Ig-like domain-containing protein n=1 Tax=Rhizobium leguminosarum TaxID=384 RepID=UPI0004808DC1|nr:Ig-like domain-containing protein [Rhizobium leguminosarum]
MTTTPITLSSNADGEAGNGNSGLAGSGSISPDGTKAVFTSAASNLVAGDVDGHSDVFLKDLVTGKVTLLSDAAGAGNAIFTPDGSKVFFVSAADNLVPGDTNGANDFFLKDLATGALTRLAFSSNGQPLSNLSDAVISADGSKIAFLAGSPKDVYVADIATGQAALVSEPGHGSGVFSPHAESYTPIFSPDGSKLAFKSNAADLLPGDTNSSTDYFVKDLSTGALTRISTAANGGEGSFGHSDSYAKVPAFSPDGTKVTFVTSSNGLIPGDSNGNEDVFVKDLQTGAITRVSTNAAGEPAVSDQGTSGFGDPVFSPDGQSVIFTSIADNLVPGGSHDPNALPFDLYSKNLATGEVTRLASGVNPNHIGFSPDGSKLLYASAGSDGIQQISYIPFEVAPHGNADSYKGGYDAPLFVSAASGVLANDIDANGDALTAALVSGPAHGAIGLKADGSFTYTPDGTYIGNDTFVYHAYDGRKYGADTSVTIKVAGNIERVDTGNDDSQAIYGAYGDKPVFSPDGKYVAFMSGSTDLVPGNASRAGQILLKNLSTGAVSVASTDADGHFSQNYSSQYPTFSDDGTKIAFARGPDIMVKDLVTGSLTLVSTTAGGAAANIGSAAPDFSPDGTKIVFYSLADNLVSGDTNTFTPDIFVKNLVTGAIVRVSSAADGSQAVGDSLSALLAAPTFSPDGKSVLFSSAATNLVAGDGNANADVFIKNLESGAVTLVSTNANGAQGNGGSLEAVFSPDGTMVAFASGAKNLVVGDDNNSPDIFVKNLVTGAISRVSTDADGHQVTNPGTMEFPVFSPDGTRIAFVSNATGLVPGSPAATISIFEKDLVTGAVRLVSTDSFEMGGNSSSLHLSYSPDGTKIVFDTYSNNLVPGDTNGAIDIYVKDLTKFPIGSPQANTPPIVNADAYVLQKDQPLHVAAAGGLLANDTDAQQNPLKAKLGTGPQHGSLTLHDDGSFDYTPDAGYAGGDSFIYLANDGRADSGKATVTLTIDGNDEGGGNTAPTNIQLSKMVVAEDTPQWTTLGLLSAFDGDGDTLKFKLIDSADGQFSLNGDRLVTAKAFDFEAKSAFSIMVEVSDGTVSVDKTFAISVKDVAEPAVNTAPHDLKFSRTGIKENIKIGSSVGLFSATDAEGNAIKWALLDDADHFKIVGNKLQTTSAIDYETIADHALTVTAQATDSLGASTVKSFTIDIQNVAEPAMAVHHDILM